MRYQILQPSAPLDPRKHHFDSLDAFHAVLPVVDADDLEEDAVASVRRRYPDALAMPCPVKIGSGTVWMLAIIEGISVPRNPDDDIPFVLFVRAQAETDRERKAIGDYKHWNRKLWKAPVLQPMIDTETVSMPVELRTSEIDEPRELHATVGHARDGRVVIYCQLAGVELSLAFSEPVQIVRIQ